MVDLLYNRTWESIQHEHQNSGQSFMQPEYRVVITTSNNPKLTVPSKNWFAAFNFMMGGDKLQLHGVECLGHEFKWQHEASRSHWKPEENDYCGSVLKSKWWRFILTNQRGSIKLHRNTKLSFQQNNSYCVIVQMILMGVASKHISLLRTYHKELSRRYPNIIWIIWKQWLLQF